jgi:ubiquinone/menaquinone biosynthesis C-methylase UbiE
MAKTMSNLQFKMMSFVYRIRDLFLPHKEILKEAGIEPGDAVLDYGCGPGGYVAAAAELVGHSGRVYAMDIQPLAIQSVQRIAARRKLANIETICGDTKTGLPDESIDVVLLYDWFHESSEPDVILNELHRILKSGGIFSLYDPLMKETEIVSRVTSGKLFHLCQKGGRAYNFLKLD